MLYHNIQLERGAAATNIVLFSQPQYQMYQQMPMGNMHQQLMYQQPRQIYMQQPPPAPPQPQVTPAEIYVQQQAAFAMATCAVALQQQFVQRSPLISQRCLAFLEQTLF